jgi:CheY-like chemotaxis protein
MVCAEAENGREAIHKAEQTRPDLIVLDLSMPVMDGLEAARQLKQLLPSIPLVLWTSLEVPHVEREAYAAGFSDVASKSDGSPVIVRSIQKLLSRAA